MQTPGLAPDGMRILAFDLDLEQASGTVNREERRLIRRFLREERTQALRIAVAERTGPEAGEESHRGFLLAAYSFVTDRNREQVVDGMLAAYGGFRRAYETATMWQGTAGMLEGGPSYVAVGLFLPEDGATPDSLVDAGVDLVAALERAHARLLPPPVDLGFRDEDDETPGSPGGDSPGEDPEPRHPALTHRITVAMGMAIDRLTSEFLEDLGKLGGHRKNRAQTTLLYRMLPPCFRSRYDEAFLRRFFVAFITGTEKMSMEHPTSFACVAEEVAFSMVMARTEFLLVSDRVSRGSLEEHTPGTLDMQPTAVSELRRYIADVLPRPTVYSLYQLTEAQTENEGMQFLLGTGWLTPDRWFEPFAQTSVHPYLSEVYNVRGFVSGP